jgi:hypothetical protein
MRNLAEIQIFLSDLGISSIWNNDRLELPETEVDNIGGTDEVLAAIRTTFGKGYSLTDCDNDHIAIVSVY